MDAQPFFTNPLHPAVLVYHANRKGASDNHFANQAVQFYGATTSDTEGPSGQAYAIPVYDMTGKTLSLNEIKWHIEAFLGYARQHKDTFFQVTRIACGPGLYQDEQIAPLFFRAPPNVWLPGKWRMLIGTLERARLTVYGPPDISDIDSISSQLLVKTKNWEGKFELITDHVSTIGAEAERWMRAQNLPITPFVPDTAKFQSSAEALVRQQMVWYSTHLIAFSDGKHEDTLSMINYAKEQGLRVGVINCVTTAASLEMLT